MNDDGKGTGKGRYPEGEGCKGGNKEEGGKERPKWCMSRLGEEGGGASNKNRNRC